MSYLSIFFGTIDPIAEQAKVFAQYAQQTISVANPSGITPVPGDPEYQILCTIAYERVCTLQALERAGKANLVVQGQSFASGANLDYVAAFIGLKRLASGPSVATVVFTLTPGHAQVVIPGGTQISSTDGTGVYVTDEDVTVPVGVNSISIDVTCTTDGTATNGFAVGTLTVIQNPQPFLQTVTNISVTSGGTDTETDAAFTARWPVALEALSVAGPKGAYNFYARSASSSIISVNTLGPEDGGVNPGSVEIRVLTNTGVPTQAILDLVFAACNPTTVRPMCDTVLVYGANPITYALNIGITALIGSNTLTMAALVQTAVQSYLSTQAGIISYSVIADAIIAAAMSVPGVKEVTLNGFTDIIVDVRSFATCTSLTTSIIAVEAP